MIGFVSDILTIIALLGAIWSACEFVQRSKREKEEERRARVSEWRSVAIHRVVSKSVPYLSTEEVLNTLKQEAFETPIEIQKADLTEPGVRKVLMEMVSDGILGQTWPDKFGIVQLQRDITVGAAIENINGRLAARRAFGEIMKHPGRFTTPELFRELGDLHELPESDFTLAILSLERDQAAKRDPEGKWSPVEPKEP